MPCRALLFDLDGVLVDSRECIEFVWHTWAGRHGCDPAAIIAVAHGRRTSETLREVAPHLDIATEVLALDALETVETRGVRPVPGAATMLGALPRDRWAIVTSGSPAVAGLRIRVAGMRVIAVAGTAPDDVLAGADYRLDRLSDLRVAEGVAGELRLGFGGAPELEPRPGPEGE